ncbi:MAG: type IV pilus modification PilV family protein, partial [Acidimicrobiia bacterium]
RGPGSNDRPPMKSDSQRGDSLIEIIFAIVVIGLVVSALLAAIVTNQNGSASHRDLVTADHVLRNYAENVKQVVRTSCTAPGVTWSPSYTAPSGYTINTLSSGVRTCPALTAIQQVDLSVALPNGTTTKTLSIAVRTP